jgi:hypothetical protein
VRSATGASTGRVRAAAAGAVAALVWGLQEPLDRRAFRSDYSDVAVLGKALFRGRGWRAVGFAAHACNGALFGLVYEEARRRTSVAPRKLAVGMALAEHVALYPLCFFVDRYHPARGEPGVPPLLTNPRAFAQATWRHAVFGTVLGRLARPRCGRGSPSGVDGRRRREPVRDRGGFASAGHAELAEDV